MSALHVKELKRAYSRIASRECDYICDALRKPISERRITNFSYCDIWNPVALEIKYVIEDALCGSFSVHLWLRDQGIETGPNDSNLMREYRLEWIERMIEYWKDK